MHYQERIRLLLAEYDHEFIYLSVDSLYDILEWSSRRARLPNFTYASVREYVKETYGVHMEVGRRETRGSISRLFFLTGVYGTTKRVNLQYRLSSQRSYAWSLGNRLYPFLELFYKSPKFCVASFDASHVRCSPSCHVCVLFMFSHLFYI